MIYIKNTTKTFFLVGIITLSVLSVLGLVYLTKMSFSPIEDKCGKVTKTEKNIARMTVVLLWIQIALVLVGSVVQTILFEGII